MERFQPKPKKIKLASKIYRLLGLKSTTPNELYLRKIESGAYDEALNLADKYDLDFDLVYQQKWRKSRVSLESIKESLMKVTKRSWIVHQCCDRLPENLTAAKELLKFGLEVTEKEIMKDLKSNCTGSPDSDPTLEQLKMDDLTLYSTELLRCRHLMLFYIDRLDIYETIIKSEGSSYWSEEYHRLRNSSILKCAVDYAREGRITPLTCLWPLLNNQEMKLTVLNNLPETINPQEYRALICSSLSFNKLCESTTTLRQKDWSEKPIFSSIWSTTWSSESTPEFEGENILSSSVDLQEWFVKRAIEIEHLTGLTNNALTLIKIGKEMGVKDLNDIYNNLLVLEILMYELGITNISLTKLQECSHLQICHHLMSKTSKESFIHDLKRLILPYSLRQDTFFNLPPIEFNLLEDYVVNLSREDLTFPALALQNRIELGLNVQQTVVIAEQCLNNNTKPEQLPLCYSIFFALPRESDNTVTPGYLIKKTEEIERILSACSILDSHGIKVTFSELKLMSSNVKKVHLLLKQMTQNVSTSNKSQSNKYDWKGLFSDILDLRSKVFSCADLEVCLEIYASALLSSGDVASINLASQVLTCNENQSLENDYIQIGKVPFNRSIELILKASREYFNSASSLHDPALELASTCLSLIECNNKEIEEESDLLSSLAILHNFGLQLLPIQVRLCNDKVTLIDECLKSSKYAYQSDQKLLQLARFLRLGGNDERAREGLILEAVGMRALAEEADSLGLAAAASAAARLAAGGHARGWKLAYRVATHLTHIDRDLRINLLAFALMHCTPDYMRDMLQTRLNLESELLEERQGRSMEIYNLHNNVDSQDSIDSNEEEFNDALTSPSVEELPLIRGIDKQFRSISSNFYNNHLKKSFGQFLRNLETSSTEDNTDSNKGGKPICQEFYKSIYPYSDVSDLTTQYNKFSMPDIVKKHFSFYISLLRIRAIEDCRTLGRNVIHLDEVLTNLAECAVVEDTTLSLSLLLTTKDTSTCLRDIESWPKTSQFIYIKMYYILLKSLILKGNDVFMWNPKKIFEVFTNNMERRVDDNDHQTAPEYLWKCFDNLKENLQNEKLKLLDSNINLTLFCMDSDYKISRILGLARSINQTNLDVALELADKYSISRFEVCYAHVEYLIMNYETIGFDICMTKLNSSDILMTLKENTSNLIQRLTSEMWDKLNGVRHQELLLFFTVFEMTCGNHSVFGLTAKEHIKLLKKIKSTYCDLDYKFILLKPSSGELIEHIVPLLKIDNVGMTIKLLRILITNLNIKLDLSNLYRKWLLKLYFSIPPHSDSSKKWMQQFRECLTYFSKMSKSDIVEFVKEICFSSEGVNRVPIPTRSIIIKQTLDYFHFENMEPNSKMSEEFLLTWEEIKCDLNEMCNFLDSLSTSQVKSIFSSRPDLGATWRQLEQAYGNKELTMTILNDLVLKLDISFRDIYELIHNLLPDLNMDDFIRYLLESHQDNHNTLKIIVNKISQSSDENIGISKHVLNKLKVFASGKFTPSEEWIKILFLRKDSNLTDEKSSQLLNQYSTEMIRSQWTDELGLDDIDFTLEESRLNIATKLISAQTLNANQIKVLVDLVNYWPTFKSTFSENENPYLLLIQKIIESDDNDNVVQLKILLENQHLESSATKWVIENTSKASVKQLLYLILLSKDKTLYDLIPFYLSKSNISNDNAVDDNLAEIIIKEKLLVKFVNTTFYSALIRYLMNKTSDSGAVKETINELAKLGHLAEASSLQLTLDGVPPALRTFATKVSFKKL